MPDCNIVARFLLIRPDNRRNRFGQPSCTSENRRHGTLRCSCHTSVDSCLHFNGTHAEEISQLLWAAQGITDGKGHRTAPSAMAKYFLTVYVASAEGLFQYIPEGHKLKKLLATDIRTKLSHQPAVTSAPAVFIITGDYDYATKAVNPNSGARWVDVEAGHATQNLLLQATAMQLGAVPSGGNDPVVVTKAASLPDTSRPIYLVPVGHPK